jgi:hypothetical protein
MSWLRSLTWNLFLFDMRRLAMVSCVGIYGGRTRIRGSSGVLEGLKRLTTGWKTYCGEKITPHEAFKCTTASTRHQQETK